MMNSDLAAIVTEARRAAARGELAAIDRAQQRLERRLELLDAGSGQRHAVKRALAETALVRHRLQPDARALARHAGRLAKLTPGDARDGQLIGLTIARLRGEVGLGGDRRAFGDARERFRSLTVTGAGDAVRREAALSWGDVTWRARLWRECAAAYDLALDLRTAAVDELLLRHAREAELALGAEAAPRAAIAHGLEREAWAAAEAIERGRASLLRRRDDPYGGEEVRTVIERAAARVPVVYLVPEHDLGMAIIVDRGAATTVELPEFTTVEVSRRLEDGIDVPHARLGMLDLEVGRWLWDAAMKRLLDAVPAGEIVLVGCGQSSALPLHAAWRTGAGGDSRRYVLDDVIVRYAPNARWAIGQSSRRPTGYRSVLAVANPLTTWDPLIHAEAEIRDIPPPFEVSKLTGAQAIRPEVLQRWSRDIVHFACHGRSSIDDPMGAGVLLSGDEWLTAEMVIDRRLHAHPLVILSACETAVIGRRLPDEVVSLQSAFLAAGANGVIATLWPVQDALAPRLLRRFYRELANGRTPAEALTAGQRAAAAGAGGLTATAAAFTYAGG